MIRFIPDTWREALLRPLAMAAPDANVYVEIMAPDLRFVFAALLAIAWLAYLRRAKPNVRTPFILLGLLAISFIPWLATSGNGRYFIPFLILVGPLCIALAYWLPWTKSARAAAALVMLLMQGYVVADTKPWISWGLGVWATPPYFDIELPSRFKETPATYVTITSISYSLVAPAFHPRSHWINISALPEDSLRSIEARNAQKLFTQSELFLVVPSLPAHMTLDGQPSEGLVDVINLQIGPQRLAVDQASRCQLAPSRGIASVALKDVEMARPETLAKLGFWICPLRYPVSVKAPEKQPRDTTIEAVFDAIEHACPRLFQPGTATTVKVSNGAVRHYHGSDMKLYVLDDGKAYYKYWRALNPEPIARAAEVLEPGWHMKRDNIRARSGLPWERVI